jgi:hypothetical protein
MGIDVAWVNERLEPEQQVFDPRQCLTRLASSSWPKSNTLCLRFIDPWGDTTFNQAQIRVLIAELRDSFEHEVDVEVKEHLGKVIRLVERAIDQVHTYVQFLGD